VIQFNQKENRSIVHQAKQGSCAHFLQRERLFLEGHFVNKNAYPNHSRSHERHAGEQRKLILIGGEALKIRNAEIDTGAAEHENNRI
jgi:hypothetical protein